MMLIMLGTVWFKKKKKKNSKDFYTRSYPLHYILNLILEKEPVFSLFNVEC